MRISRYLKEEAIKLEMSTVVEPLQEGSSLEKWRQAGKEKVIEELVLLLEQGCRIGNRTKLVMDFVNRERKATTGIGKGIAIPHIRSLQAKDLTLAFGRSTRGYDFDALDHEPVHLFFAMAAPPYDDSLYLKVFKSLAGMLQHEPFREELLTISCPGEVIRAIRNME